MMLNSFKNRCQKNRGFTLVEMLVAMLVFSLIAGAISGLFINGIRSQRATLIFQRLLDQTSYTLEYMSRALRMAIKDTGQTCLPSGSNYEITRGGSGLKFRNHLEGDDCQEFFLQDGQLKQTKKILTSPETMDLTSSKLEIISLNFILSGETQDDTIQPKMTMAFEIKGLGQQSGEQPVMIIQTTISQRNLDIKQ